MIRKRFLVSVMAAALILGGTAPASKTQVKAADQKIIVLKTPQQASKAINQSTSANSKGRSANAKMTKQQREELIKSRIIVKSEKAPQKIEGVKQIYYYSVGDYYILQCISKQAADSVEKQLKKQYDSEEVIRDRVITQSDDTDGQPDTGDTGETTDNGNTYTDYVKQNEDEQVFDGIHMMGMDTLKEQAKDWQGQVEVAVIDSGIDRDHELFTGRIDTEKSINLSGQEPENQYDDTYGHGSHVSGIITQATPDQVKIMTVRVFDDYQMSSLTQITMGIDYARENGADVMNMSLGHTSPTDSELKLINDSMEKSVKQESVLLAASGNEANNVSTSCPANNSWTISVGSVQPNPTDRTRYTRSWFSNYGKRLDFVAPGNNINSAWADGTIVSLKGTSMATPHMAAAAAMVKLKHHDYDQWRVYATFLDYTKDLGAAGKDDYFGNGYVDLSDYASEKTASKENKRYQAISAKAVTKTTMNSVGKSFSLDAKLEEGNGKLTYQTSNAKVAQVTSDGKVVIKGVGKCEITIKASATDSYKETVHTVQVEVQRGQQTINLPSRTYTKTMADKKFKLAATVAKPGNGTISYITNNEDIITISKDGYITPKKTGTAKVYAIAAGTNEFEEAVSDSITLTIKAAPKVVKKPVNPGKAKITKLKKGKKSFKVTYKKQTKATGYYVRYSLKKSMKGAKTVKVKGKTYLTVKKLKSKKRYYVQVRAYNTVSGKTAYGSWSTKKSIKVK